VPTHAISSRDPMVSIRSSSIRLPSLHTAIFLTAAQSTTVSGHASLPTPGRSAVTQRHRCRLNHYSDNSPNNHHPHLVCQPNVPFSVFSYLHPSPQGQSLLPIARRPCSNSIQTVLQSNGCHLPFLWCKALARRTGCWPPNLSNVLSLLSPGKIVLDSLPPLPSPICPLLTDQTPQADTFAIAFGSTIPALPSHPSASDSDEFLNTHGPWTWKTGYQIYPAPNVSLNDKAEFGQHGESSVLSTRAVCTSHVQKTSESHRSRILIANSQYDLF
jgi:hypothetical protein